GASPERVYRVVSKGRKAMSLTASALLIAILFLSSSFLVAVSNPAPESVSIESKAPDFISHGAVRGATYNFPAGRESILPDVLGQSMSAGSSHTPIGSSSTEVLS